MTYEQFLKWLEFQQGTIGANSVKNSERIITFSQNKIIGNAYFFKNLLVGIKYNEL
jgi:hypothetical protein